MKTGRIRRKGLSSQHEDSLERRGHDGRARLEATAWELPSGERLAEYALRARFFTPSLLAGYENVHGGGGVRRSDAVTGGQR